MSEHDDNVYLNTEASEERLDQAVKEYVWDSLQKKFVPYPHRIEDKLDADT